MLPYPPINKLFSTFPPVIPVSSLTRIRRYARDRTYKGRRTVKHEGRCISLLLMTQPIEVEAVKRRYTWLASRTSHFTTSCMGGLVNGLVGVDMCLWGAELTAPTRVCAHTLSLSRAGNNSHILKPDHPSPAPLHIERVVDIWGLFYSHFLHWIFLLLLYRVSPSSLLEHENTIQRSLTSWSNRLSNNELFMILSLLQKSSKISLHDFNGMEDVVYSCTLTQKATFFNTFSWARRLICGDSGRPTNIVLIYYSYLNIRLPPIQLVWRL